MEDGPYLIEAIYRQSEGIWFDQDHYRKVHIPLVEKTLKGRVAYSDMYARFDVRPLDDPSGMISACIFNMHLADAAALKDFQEFFGTEDMQPLVDDVPKYTNAEPEWSISYVVR